MSGGRLVVLDRLGRDVKAFTLEEGLATIGSDPVCDIRVMLPTVSPHHATVVVHTNQTVVRSVSAGDTLVNGAAVSVAALRHGDQVTIAGRSLRWEYNEPDRFRPLAPQPALVRRAMTGARGAQRRSHPAVDNVLVPEQRASMPGSSSGKQVAIVQPQRRDTSDKKVPASATPAGGARSKRATLSRSSKSQPLRVSLLRAAVNVTKIQAPSKIDHTKQAAIMLMTGHTSKGKQTPPKPGFVLKKPVRRTPKNPKTPTGIRKVSKGVIGVTPKRASAHTSKNSEASKKASILEISDSNTPGTATRRSVRNTTIKSPSLSSPKKSSLKDPAKKPNGKSESIKFDLSNLQDDGQDRSSDVMFAKMAKECSCNIASHDDMTLHYPDSSPSPRKSIHSRSSKMLETSLGTMYTQLPVQSDMSTPVNESSSARKSLRSGLIVQKALEKTDSDTSRYSCRSTKTMSEQSFNTVTSARKTKTLSPRTSRNIESYSIVDLVSINSNDSASIIYDSVDSNSASLKFDTPQNQKKTRSFNLAGSSTPYSKSKNSKNSVQSPLGSKHLPKKDSDVRIVEDGAGDSLLEESEDSPWSSRSAADAESPGSGSRTPILCIQNLLNQNSSTRRKRKTLPTSASSNEKPKLSVKSRSLGVMSRRSQRARKSSPPDNQTSQDKEIVTPKSAVKLVQEAVKNKHSTAKKPTSKRAIIDDLNESDLVKQLFNSPVKRKLSRSMTEFSRKELFEDDEVAPLKYKRNTAALTGRTPDHSLLNDTEAFTPEVFVSPIRSPGNSPNLSGIRRLFKKNTPENDLRNVKGVKTLLRTPRNRKSIKNDLTNVSGVKKIFGKSPRNRLSNVRIKEVFAASPNNDLRQVWGVRSLFQGNKGKSPKNTLEDVRGVKKLFNRCSPRNDLGDFSRVKNLLSVNSPRNDLTEVRGVKDLYREKEERNNLSDLSGIEELFYEPSNLDSTFDLLVGKPRVRSYRKAKSFIKISKHSKPARNAKSLHCAIDSITNNVEEWLENELKKRAYNKQTPKISVNKCNLTRELEKLSTDTIAGSTPLRKTRVRNNSSIAQQSLAANKTVSELYSAHKLPIKKRRVLHSTPVKGGGVVPNDTIGARELGRVSPIQRLEPLHESLDHKPSNCKEKVIKVTVEASERSRRTRRKPVSSPPPARKTNTKKRRSSLVLKKKTPAIVPKPTPKEEKVQVDVKRRQIKTNSMRQKRQVQPKIATPKVTRAKDISLVVTMSSSRNPRPTRNINKKITIEDKEVKTGGSRKITNNATSDKNVDKIESAPEQGVRKRGRKAEIITDEMIQKPVKKGRKNITVNETKDAGAGTKGRRTRAITETQSNVETVKYKPAKKITKEVIDTKDKENEAPNKSSRRALQKTEVDETVNTKKTTRGRRAKINNITINENKATFKEKTKGTKIKSVDKMPPKTRRGARTGDGEENKQSEEKNKEKKQTNKTNPVINEGRKTRNAAKEVEVKPTRGRKVTIVEEQTGATNDKKRGRKRKAESVEPPPEVAAVGEKKRRATRASTRTKRARGREPQSP